MPLVDLSADALARLEAQLQADLDAVRRTRALLASQKGQAPAAPSAPAPAVTAPVPVVVPASAAPSTAPSPAQPAAPVFHYVPRPSAAEMVPKAVVLMEGVFGMDQIKEVMIRERLGSYPETDIRAVLKGLVKKGELLIAETNRGRGGSTYRRA